MIQHVSEDLDDSPATNPLNITQILSSNKNLTPLTNGTQKHSNIDIHLKKAVDKSDMPKGKRGTVRMTSLPPIVEDDKENDPEVAGIKPNF